MGRGAGRNRRLAVSLGFRFTGDFTAVPKQGAGSALGSPSLALGTSGGGPGAGLLRTHWTLGRDKAPPQRLDQRTPE